MAIDTRNRRSSAINPQCPWRGMWPAPDSTIDQADRQHTLWSYAGILAGGSVFTPTETYCVCASQAYVAGSERSDVYNAGSERAQGDCC